MKTLTVLLAFIGADIVVGLAKALSTTGYSSAVMRQGLFHKIGEILGFLFGFLCDIELPKLGIIVPISISSAIAVYITMMEIGSIIENFGQMNPGMAKYLSKLFSKVTPPEEIPAADTEKPHDETE